MASNKKSYDGAHDYKQELKSGYRHSEWFETNTCPNTKFNKFISLWIKKTLLLNSNGMNKIQTTLDELEQCIALNGAILTKIDEIIEICILSMYMYSVNCILSDRRFSIKKTDIGFDVIANEDIKKGDVLWNSLLILKVYSKYIIEKYAAYIYNDYYIIDGFGMLLNNKDEHNKENCTFCKESHNFVATTSIKRGESIRMDYQMKTNDYPPIPKEIKSLRSTMVV